MIHFFFPTLVGSNDVDDYYSKFSTQEVFLSKCLPYFFSYGLLLLSYSPLKKTNYISLTLYCASFVSHNSQIFMIRKLQEIELVLFHNQICLQKRTFVLRKAWKWTNKNSNRNRKARIHEEWKRAHCNFLKKSKKKKTRWNERTKFGRVFSQGEQQNGMRKCHSRKTEIPIKNREEETVIMIIKHKSHFIYPFRKTSEKT